MAPSFDASVGVGFLGGDSVVHNIHVGERHDTAIAALVSVLTASAVDEFLLREGDEGFVLEVVCGFKTSNGGEGPA